MKKLVLLVLLTFGTNIARQITITNDSTTMVKVGLYYKANPFCFDDVWVIQPGKTKTAVSGVCCLDKIQVVGIYGDLKDVDSGVIQLNTNAFTAICQVNIVIKEKDKQFVVEHTATH